MTSKPKIFVSAYACEPGLGSEIGVGWHWVLEMSRYFELWVLTRESNRPTIEPWIAAHPEFEPDCDARWLPEALRSGYENGMKVTLDFNDDDDADWTILSGEALDDFNGKLSFYFGETELALGAEFSEGRGLYRDEDGSYKFGTIVKNG